MTADQWDALLLAATAVHAGFQLTITWLVYPALGELAASSWGRSHAAHSRRIVPLVGLVYLAVVVTAVGSLLVEPDVAHLVAAAGSAVVLVLTAGFAGPLHGRLGPERDPRLFRRLLAVDAGRAAFALVALAAALVAAIG